MLFRKRVEPVRPIQQKVVLYTNKLQQIAIHYNEGHHTSVMFTLPLNFMLPTDSQRPKHMQFLQKPDHSADSHKP